MNDKIVTDKIMQGFEQFFTEVMPAVGVSRAQKESMRQAFFAGAWFLYITSLTTADEEVDITRKPLATPSPLITELVGFFVDLEGGPGERKRD